MAKIHMKSSNLYIIKVNLLLIAVFLVQLNHVTNTILMANNSNNLTYNSNTNNNYNNSNSYDNDTSIESEYALILIQQQINLFEVQKKFYEFQETFNINFDKISIEFEVGYGLISLFNNLENSKYSTILYVLSEVDEKDAGYCDMSEKLSEVFNRTVIFWPCPKMKQTEKFLPAYETVSFAVKCIAQEFNWTEAVIFASETNWGLPLAIAANLHVPYRIEIGIEVLIENNINDQFGKVVIICSELNSKDTRLVIQHFEHFNRTKILLIDTVGAIFNSENQFYKFINEIRSSTSPSITETAAPPKDYSTDDEENENVEKYEKNMTFEEPKLTLKRQKSNTKSFKSNLNKYHNFLVLTILTEKFKQFMNSTLHIELIKHYHKLHKRSIVADETTAVDHSRTKFIKGHPSSKYEKDNNSIDNNNNNNNSNLNNSLLKDKCDLEFFMMNLFNSNNISHNHNSYNNNNSLIEICCKYFKSSTNNKIILKFCDVSHNNEASSMTASTQNDLSDIDKRKNSNNKNRLILGDAWEIDDIKLPRSKMIYSEFFILYDYISTIFNATNDTTSFKFDFILLDFQKILTNDNDTIYVWRPFLILKQDEIDRNLFTTHRMLPGFNNWFIGNTDTFFICGVLCWGIIVITILFLILIIFASVIAGVAVRNYLLKKRLSKGPNKIVLSPSDFVFPVDSRRVDEGIEAMLCCWLQQLQEFGGPEVEKVEKPDLLKGSIGSLKNLGLPAAKNSSGSGSLARHNNNIVDMKARYNGDLVQLKEIQIGSMTELKSKAMDFLVMTHGLRHENINPFIGWLSDQTRTAMVFEYCSRGSLQDVLIMDEIKLDWSFRLSLLTDLVRGMRYLHSSPLRVHGALSSRNCVVDARWVLKITDYGLSTFYEALGGQPPMTKSAKELLWTAPEALRNLRNYPKCGTQPSDVYSFGIIMQEVVVRGEPYCMLSLSPEEIITKIKRPPPLIRPSVSKGAAPPEAINIMRQCWAEMPEMRPDFNTVYERFKQLNHGRKVNFVDTMFQMLEKYSNNLEELIRERTDQLDIERKKTEQLLNRMLPSSVAEKLKMGLGVDPEEFAEVTIYFSDIVGFTTIAAHCSPVQVVDLLNDLYTCFDATINAYNVYKVETIGDAYMVVSGLPVRTPDHAEQIATMALDLLHQSGRFRIKHLPGVPLQLRIGLHTGPCCAGVVGLTMPRYCLFGDTVNTASRMESTGSSWRIHLSEQVRDRLEKAGGYYLEQRGPIEIKGKGMMNTYWLSGKKGFDKLLPTPPAIGESHGLDETLIQKSLLMRQAVNKSTTNPSSAFTSSNQSPSGPGESFDIKVEITPPGLQESVSMSNSFSIDSNATLPNMNLNIAIPEYQSKSTSISPQQRKLSELPAEGLLNPANFTRLNPATGGSVNRLFRRLEDMMDLSFPYNHYRCLSPSESNLSQCADGKAQFMAPKFDGTSKPGSTRLLRRQFSLDKEDGFQNQIQNKSAGPNDNTSTIINMQDKQQILNQIVKSQMSARAAMIHKQNSNSMAQDLEKIEEIPISPSSQIDENSPSSVKTLTLGATILDEKSDRETISVITETNSSSPTNTNTEIKLSVESLVLR